MFASPESFDSWSEPATEIKELIPVCTPWMIRLLESGRLIESAHLGRPSIMELPWADESCLEMFSFFIRLFKSSERVHLTKWHFNYGTDVNDALLWANCGICICKLNFMMERSVSPNDTVDAYLVDESVQQILSVSWNM